jgi:phosphohistidine phosphatase
MILCLVRHADAATVGETMVRDADRPLTAAGEEAAARLGTFLGTAERGIGLVLCSPLLRARQTADLVAAHHPGRPAVRATETLAPGFSRRRLLEEILALAEEGPLAAIGHQPDIGALISFLISGSIGVSVVVPPGSAAKITFAGTPDRPDGRLDWLLSPDLLPPAVLPPGGKARRR